MEFSKLVGVLKELGYIELDTIYFKDPTVGMNVLVDDKDELDIVDLCNVHLGIDIDIQHPMS